MIESCGVEQSGCARLVHIQEVVAFKSHLRHQFSVLSGEPVAPGGARKSRVGVLDGLPLGPVLVVTARVAPAGQSKRLDVPETPRREGKEAARTRSTASLKELVGQRPDLRRPSFGRASLFLTTQASCTLVTLRSLLQAGADARSGLTFP